jgi:ubiquitin
MKRTNEKKYEFKCSKCGELKEKIVSQKLIKQFKQQFRYDIEKLGLINLSITCDECIEIIVKEKKCKLCGAPLKNYLNVFCSSKCHKTYLKKKDRLSFSEVNGIECKEVYSKGLHLPIQIKIDHSKGPEEIEFTGVMPSKMIGRIPIPRDVLVSFSQIDDIKDNDVKDRGTEVTRKK